MSMFSELLTIKRLRENEAELAFMRQRQRRTEAQERVDKARSRLQTFRNHARSQEQSMYEGLCERVVRVRDIETVLQEVAQLRKDEGFYESALQKADETLDQEIDALSECRRTHTHTVRQSNKFLELVKVYQNEETQLQNSQEDQELEEVAALTHDRFRWHDDEDAV